MSKTTTNTKPNLGWLVEAKAEGSWFRVSTWPSREEAEVEAEDIRKGTWPVEDARVCLVRRHPDPWAGGSR